MNLALPDWVTELQTALSREYGDAARFATLTTCDSSHRPHARTIVMRVIDDDGTIWFCTDVRSEKVRQIAHNDSVELTIYLRTLRWQYRIEAYANRVVEREPLLTLWTKLKDTAKVTFTRPMPGVARDDAAISHAKVPDEMPGTFAAYRIVPTQVEFLSVAEPEHPRWIARQSDGWIRHAVNP